MMYHHPILYVFGFGKVGRSGQGRTIVCDTPLTTCSTEGKDDSSSTCTTRTGDAVDEGATRAIRLP
jgi:hypothetical protein